MLSIGADPRDTADERFRKRLLVGVALVILPVALLWGCLYWIVGERGVALTPWAYFSGSAISLVVFARTRNFASLRTAQQLLILVAPAAGTVVLGGLRESSGVLLWSLFAPLGAVAFDRPGRAWPWFAAFVATILLALVLSEVVRPDGADLPDAFVRTFDVLNIVVVSAVAMLLLVTFARGRDAAQARVETLLLNVLPAEVAQRLQSDPNSIADHFDVASILFADVVDFTPLSSRLDAREVVGLLDRLFTSFDELVDRYGVEKIKTIGDCYMAAAGVPGQRPDHAHALAGLALEMGECAKRCLPDRDGHHLRLRIGISSGPVVAGVIGRRRFLYDLWGDTVNMASRMESHGTPDEIQITRSTWELLDDDFVTEPIGLVDVKGKGKVETWAREVVVHEQVVIRHRLPPPFDGAADRTPQTRWWRRRPERGGRHMSGHCDSRKQISSTPNSSTSPDDHRTLSVATFGSSTGAGSRQNGHTSSSRSSPPRSRRCLYHAGDPLTRVSASRHMPPSRTTAAASVAGGQRPVRDERGAYLLALSENDRLGRDVEKIRRQAELAAELAAGLNEIAVRLERDDVAFGRVGSAAKAGRRLRLVVATLSRCAERDRDLLAGPWRPKAEAEATGDGGRNKQKESHAPPGSALPSPPRSARELDRRGAYLLAVSWKDRYGRSGARLCAAPDSSVGVRPASV